MIYELLNQQDAARLIRQIALDQTEGQQNVADFKWFVVTIDEAITKNLRVDFRYDTNLGLKVITGRIISAVIDYNSGKPNPTSISITYRNESNNQKETLNSVFNAELVEENKLSIPGSHMKYYINDEDSKVIVCLLFYYQY